MKQSSRNSSVELLRIIAMCGVVLLHYNNTVIGGGLRYASGLNLSALILLESLFICAVNLYILISGYFLSVSSTRKLIKPLELIVQVCIFGLLRYTLNAAIAGSFSFWWTDLTRPAAMPGTQRLPLTGWATAHWSAAEAPSWLHGKRLRTAPTRWLPRWRLPNG